jgi:hypothetical protein
MDELALISGEKAWDSVDGRTRDTIKEGVMAESENGIETDEIAKKLNIPEPVVVMAVAELIDEGRLIEPDVEIGEVMAVARQNRNTLDRIERRQVALEKKIDMLAEGIVILKRILLKEDSNDKNNSGNNQN